MFAVLRLVKAEFIRIMKSPGNFAMIFIIVALTAWTASYYFPVERNDPKISINQDTVTEIYYHYLDNNKISADEKLANISSILSEHNSQNAVFDELEVRNVDISNMLNTFKIDPADPLALENLHHEFISFKDFYEDSIDSSNVRILVRKTQHSQFLDTLNSVITRTDPDHEFLPHEIDEYFEQSNYYNFLRNPITRFIEDINKFEISEDIYNQTTAYISQADSRLSGIHSEIETFETETGTSNETDDKSEILTMITNYVLTVNQTFDIVYSSIHLDALQDYSQREIFQLKNFNSMDYNKYYLNEKMTRAKFLFLGEYFEYEYANPLTVSMTSNFTINGYDFSFYALEIIMIFITIYFIILAGKSIAGEQSSGTLKLLAMRPLKRYKIILGKMLALVLMAMFLLGLSLGLALAVGNHIFNLESNPILLIFNGSVPIVIAPLNLLLLFLGLSLIKLCFYIIVTMALSVIIKSYMGSALLAIGVYFVSLLINITPNISWLKWVPFFHGDLYKYFGTAFISSSTFQGLEMLISGKILQGADFIISAQILATVMLIAITVTITIFSSRDIN